MPLNLSQFAGSFTGILLLGAIAALAGAAQPAPDTSVRTLTAERIDIREPDGTLRLVISNSARAPGLIIKGHEQPHPSRRSAGLIFFNDEGTENGGLIFDGRASADGARHSGGSLTFDRYEQDQVVQVMANEDGPSRTSGLIVNDQPEQTMDWAAIDRARTLPPGAQRAAFRAAHAGGTPRLFLGRTPDDASALTLRDAAGHPRLVISVAANGEASIDFLDPAGKRVRRLAPSPP